MTHKKLFLILVLVVLGLYCSKAVAVSPLGPPVSNLGKGQSNIGIGYTYSEMDLRFNNGTSPGGGPSFMMDDIKTNAVFVDIARGLGKKWEVFFQSRCRKHKSQR